MWKEGTALEIKKSKRKQWGTPVLFIVVGLVGAILACLGAVLDIESLYGGGLGLCCIFSFYALVFILDDISGIKRILISGKGILLNDDILLTWEIIRDVHTERRSGYTSSPTCHYYSHNYLVIFYTETKKEVEQEAKKEICIDDFIYDAEEIKLAIGYWRKKAKDLA